MPRVPNWSKTNLSAGFARRIRHHDVVAIVADKVEVFLMGAHIPLLGALHSPENSAVITVSLPARQIRNRFHANIVRELGKTEHYPSSTRNQ